MKKIFNVVFTYSTPIVEFISLLLYFLGHIVVELVVSIFLMAQKLLVKDQFASRFHSRLLPITVSLLLYSFLEVKAWDLKLIWDPSQTVGVSYKVYSAKNTDAFSLWGTSTTTNFVMTGLLTNTLYRVYITAYNTNGESTSSNIGSTNYNPTISPIIAPPTNLRFTDITADRININWTYPDSDQILIDGFILEQSQNTQPFTVIATSIQPDTRDGSIDNLRKNTYYSYRIYAYNTKEKSNYSNIATARTLRR